MSADRPLDAVSSIKVKLGLLVAVSVVVAVLVDQIGDAAGVPLWMSIPVTVAAALAATQWLARGMTAPLDQMTSAVRAMAGGDYGQRVTATSTDEVGVLAGAFNAMAADLASADLQRRELVATVSHELRTPLTAQRALLENLVDGVVGPDDDALGKALHQAERLSELVTDLLDLSRIDAGAAPLRLAEVRVEDLLRQAVDESAVDGRPVRVHHSVVPAGLTVVADPARIAQLLANLVDNAIRHSPSYGEVRVVARVVDEGAWLLEVGDDGPGIPAERATRVFDRFGSLDATGGGTGLGLAIARWVAELHGGTVAVVPTPADQTGALLRVRLPRSPRPSTTTEETPMTLAPHPAPTPGAPGPSDPLGVPAASGAPPNPAPSQPAPSPAGGPPSSTSANTIWPESDGRPRPVVVLAALGIGTVAALTWPYRGIGLATALVLLLAGALMWVVARNRTRHWTIACGVLATALVLATVVRDAGGVVTLAVLAGVVVTAAGLTRAHGLLAHVAAAAAWPLSAVRGLPLLGRTFSATSRLSLLWPVLRTLAVSIVALAVFGGLFASGDALFGSWASALVPDLGWDTIVLRTFLLTLVTGVCLTGAYLAINPPAVDVVRLPDSPRTRQAWEWAVPVGLVVVLFAGVLGAQATAMWGGVDHLRRTTGLSYAEYVHQGFAQLTVATFLTLVVAAATLRVASVATVRERALVRALVGALGVLTLAVVASALYRMSLYQDAFGFTVLRVFVDGFELWLGLLVLMLLVALVRLSGAWLPRAALVTGAAFTLGFVAMNPDAWVASNNVDRFEQTGVIDASYLSTLSADATPVIVERLPGELATCIVGSSGALEFPDDALSWNLGRSRAASATASLPDLPDPASVRASDGDGPCTPYLSSEYGAR